jgi:hypothetical protein
VAVREGQAVFWRLGIALRPGPGAFHRRTGARVRAENSPAAERKGGWHVEAQRRLHDGIAACARQVQRVQRLLLNRAESVASRSRKADGQVLAKSTYGLMLNQKRQQGDADLLRRAVKDDASGGEPTWEKNGTSQMRELPGGQRPSCRAHTAQTARASPDRH